MIKEYEIYFEYKSGLEGEYGFCENLPYRFKGEFDELILHFKDLIEYKGVKVKNYKVSKTFANLEITQELLKKYTLDNALMLQFTNKPKA